MGSAAVDHVRFGARDQIVRLAARAALVGGSEQDAVVMGRLLEAEPTGRRSVRFFGQAHPQVAGADGENGLIDHDVVDHHPLTHRAIAAPCQNDSSSGKQQELLH